LNYAALLRSALVALLRNKMRSILTYWESPSGLQRSSALWLSEKRGNQESSSSSIIWATILCGLKRGTGGQRCSNGDAWHENHWWLADAIAIKNQIR